MVLRVGIIGAGPSGLFLAHRLLKRVPKLEINFYEKRQGPFGLLKFGVAPDHPEVKAIAKRYEYILGLENVKIDYGVKVGSKGQTTLQALERQHDAIAICSGMESPRLLRLPGTELGNCISASQFVAWYNGDPELSGTSSVKLSNVKKVAIIGNGNVALDVARILLRPSVTLVETDISPSALRELQASPIDTVDIIGRRGPAEASFTPAELREIFGLQNVDFRWDDSTVCELEAILKDPPATRAKARLVEIFASKFLGDRTLSHKDNSVTEPVRRCNFFFHQAPVAVNGTNRITSISFRLASEQLDSKDGEHAKPPLVTRDYDMLVSAIGFKAEDSLGLPLDESGAIKNYAGKVLDHDNLYVAGWAAYGAKGDLSSTMLNSFAVAEAIAAGLAGKASSLDDHRNC